MKFISKSWETDGLSGGDIEKNKSEKGIHSVEACGTFASLLIGTYRHFGLNWECWEELCIKGIEAPEQVNAISETVGVRVSLTPLVQMVMWVSRQPNPKLILSHGVGGLS